MNVVKSIITNEAKDKVFFLTTLIAYGFKAVNVQVNLTWEQIVNGYGIYFEIPFSGDKKDATLVVEGFNEDHRTTITAALFSPELRAGNTVPIGEFDCWDDLLSFLETMFSCTETDIRYSSIEF